MDVGHFPDESLKDVSWREQPLAVAALVDYESQGHARAFECLQCSGCRNTLRNKDWLPQRFQQVYMLTGHHPHPGVLDRRKADEIVEVPACDRIVRMAMFYYQAPVFLGRVFGVQPDDCGPGRHEFAHRAVVEAQGAAHEFPLLPSKTPARSPSTRRVSTSCSVIGGSAERRAPSSRSTTSVEVTRSQTPGEAKVDRKRIGRAKREAAVSGSLSAKRLGTSSPMIRER